MLVIATGKVAVSINAAAEIVAARSTRTSLYLLADTPGVYYGADNTVTKATGYPLTGINAVAERILTMEGAIYAIGASGNVTYMEIYDDGT